MVFNHFLHSVSIQNGHRYVHSRGCYRNYTEKSNRRVYFYSHADIYRSPSRSHVDHFSSTGNHRTYGNFDFCRRNAIYLRFCLLAGSKVNFKVKNLKSEQVLHFLIERKMQYLLFIFGRLVILTTPCGTYSRATPRRLFCKKPQSDSSPVYGQARGLRRSR